MDKYEFDWHLEDVVFDEFRVVLFNFELPEENDAPKAQDIENSVKVYVPNDLFVQYVKVEDALEEVYILTQLQGLGEINNMLLNWKQHQDACREIYHEVKYLNLLIELIFLVVFQ